MLKHVKILFALFILASIALFISCQDQQPVATNDAGQMNLSKVSSLVIPAGATVVSANLKLYAWSFGGDPHNVDIHNITADWSCPVSWNSFAGAYDPTVITSFNAFGLDWKTIDITSTVLGWLGGDPNYGLLLKNQDIQGLAQFLSVENIVDPNLAPYLEVELSTGEIIEVEPLADTYIYSLDPENSYCTDPTLYCGFIEWPGLGVFEKQPLIRFEVEPTPPGGGCTLTPGYWKTHSEFGPAPYDDTWAQLPNGASTTFFLSGKSYYQVLWTSPAGNAYYNLSFHYIAAGLNFMNGADPSAAQAAYDAATTLFNTYTPAQIAVLKGSNQLRQQFISLAGILGQYNEGYIGPGHCDD